jgi:simple sugar transport system substrate-binding protein
VKFSRTAKIAAAFAVAALALTGVNAQAANAANTKTVYVLGGGDAFFAVVKNGYNAGVKAVKASGWKTVWLGLKNYDNIGPDMVKLMNTAISRNASAIALPDWNPTAMNATIKKAVAKGIKVVLYNAGIDQVETVGAALYIGSDEYKAGKAGGAYLGSLGAKHVICVNTNPGQTNLEARCNGLADGIKTKGGKGEQLELPTTTFGNATAVANAVKGAVTKDTTIDAVFTIASGDSDAAATGVAAAGSKALLGTFDLSVNVLNRIKAGKQALAIDQQGWLEGFQAVVTAWQYAAYGIYPADNILTGPSLITKSNITKVLAGVKTGVR